MFDVIIIGSGPAGLTAAIYTSRASLKTLVLAGKKWGGQLILTTEVENFSGFPDGIMGPMLMANMRKQAERFGTEIIDKEAVKADFSKKPFKIYIEDGHSSGSFFTAKSVIIATGADTMWLGVPGEQRLIGRGVSSCAPCDAFFYRNKKVIVVGGGDSAMEEALVLTKFAESVTIVHRRDSFRASAIMATKVQDHPKVETVWNTTVEEIIGSEKVEKVKLKTGEKVWEMPIDGVFVAIGHKPNTALFKDILQIDEKGYIRKCQVSSIKYQNEKQKYPSMTSVEGVFVAGDVHDYTYRQAITAAGFGCEAAMDVERWLEEQR